MTAAVAPLPQAPSMISVHSDLLGAFSIEAGEAIEFRHGLLGFPECRRFALVRAGTDSLFWLQSLEYSALVFLLVDPFAHFPGYAVDVTLGDRQELRIADPSDLALLAIVTLPAPDREGQPTANLQGPIAVNLRTRAGKQLVVADERFGVRCPLVLPAAGVSGR